MMMKVKMSGPFLLLFLFILPLSSSTRSGSILSTSYIYIENFYTWESAQSYCRRHYNDLAVFNQQLVESNVTMDQYKAWIGAYAPPEHKGIWIDRKYNYTAKDLQSGVVCRYVDSSSQRSHDRSCKNGFFFYCFNQDVRGVTFIPLSKTWLEALAYCRTNYYDLVAHPNTRFLDYGATQDFPVWIGLPSNVSLESSGDCVSISSVGKVMTKQDCSDQLPFLCVKENLLLVLEEKSWEEALEHCRGLLPAGSYDLVSVQPGEDQEHMVTKDLMAHTEEVWVALRFLAGDWFWVDGAEVSYPDLPRCPLQWKHCGALTRNSSSSVEARDCEERKNFLCSQSST